MGYLLWGSGVNWLHHNGSAIYIYICICTFRRSTWRINRVNPLFICNQWCISPILIQCMHSWLSNLHWIFHFLIWVTHIQWKMLQACLRCLPRHQTLYVFAWSTNLCKQWSNPRECWICSRKHYRDVGIMWFSNQQDVGSFYYEKGLILLQLVLAIIYVP